jgi:hypothetical protein
MKRAVITTATLLLSALCVGPAYAGGTILGHVKALQHWAGHSGILIKLDETMTDPDSCGRTDWYIMPDASQHAQFVQAMLLTAQSAGRPVFITLSGCTEGMPALYAVENSAPPS